MNTAESVPATEKATRFAKRDMLELIFEILEKIAPKNRALGCASTDKMAIIKISHIDKAVEVRCDLKLPNDKYALRIRGLIDFKNKTAGLAIETDGTPTFRIKRDHQDPVSAIDRGAITDLQLETSFAIKDRSFIIKDLKFI